MIGEVAVHSNDIPTYRGHSAVTPNRLSSPTGVSARGGAPARGGGPA